MPNFSAGGAERVALLLLGGLDPQAFAPQLAVLDSSGPLRSLVAEGVTLHEIGQKRLRRAVPALLRLIRQERPAVIFSGQGYLNVALLALKPLLPRGTKLALREASTPSLSLPHQPRPRVMTWAYRRFYPRVDLLFCQHRGTETEMVADFGVAKERIRSLPNPVPVAALRRAAEPVVRAPGPGLRFVAAGRLAPEKGFDRLIELFAGLPGDSRLTIYGEGQERAALVALLDRLDAAGRVDLAGFTDSLPAALAGADACLVSSHWEGLPNVALESLACGTPVVATPESGGLAELAQAAPADAVTIAPWGDAFRRALAACPRRAPRTPTPSLLPPGYDIAEVQARFTAALHGLAEAEDLR
jgi:glycosyltransferase involved in cell wall biosynthesis